jgi:SAM-dependent methyltransferase
LEPLELGRRYDVLAPSWAREMVGSDYGVAYLRRAIALCASRRQALDVGCGTGGRMIDELLRAGLEVTGLDVSAGMLERARQAHPSVRFVRLDFRDWPAVPAYDLVVAWDSIFHVPHGSQREVVDRLCRSLVPGGVLLFTAGGHNGEIHGEMGGERFYYSSLDAHEYLRILSDASCDCILLERDQHPEDHLVVLATRRRD